MIQFAVVTPSFNQVRFIRETVDSVLSQAGDFKIDYVVVDGGSDDGTPDVLSGYQERLDAGRYPVRCRGVRFRWISEPDEGQYDAINKGFAAVDGDVMAWINSDDKYTEWAFSTVGTIFTEFADTDWLTSTRPIIFNEAGQATHVKVTPGFNRESFMRAANLLDGRGFNRSWVPQDNTFWRRPLWRERGGLDIRYHFAADFDLWLRFFEVADLHAVSSPLAGYRTHPDQKTEDQLSYNREAQAILRAAGGKPYGRVSSFLRRKVLSALATRRGFGRLCRHLKLLTCSQVIVSPDRCGQWERREEWRP